ncbi:DEDD exonuclease domain-containing protein [Allonocardiopsis opalescens]|uniref:DNA polymerase-3 subunit epsilon n=1 Tax=Allonocardiopsis opalescens TaxID=1144618 RepID=A0A2T0Q040_9ACTN|nr:DEDD exonuclease domain-containing protein [Allonocardiopsis opalescens]PRX97033.1 DNA polymerase-3 subunit epsilon [Allonocardiopsis opalescens]
MSVVDPLPVQGTLDDLGTPLSEVTFVVFDLETTGTRAAASGITEIGAVKVRGGEVVGEFATLVDPGSPVPPFITVLTGITDAMLVGAPRIETVLPSFLEFAEGCVLVAHNAPFDVGFIRTACAEHGYTWPDPPVVDTVPLARRALTRDEVRNHKLSTLADFFRVPEPPNHRALADARATVAVLHGLLERLGSFGVATLEELRSFTSAPSAVQRRKRHLADGLPDAPGVYMFTDARGDALYVGKSTSLRKRVRTYFTAAETRSRMGEMVALAEAVVPIPCATPLEAEVRELRLIAQHKPPYNRKSKFPERAVWLKLTAETYPRLSIVRALRSDGATYLGPFGSTSRAERARAALHEAFPLRQCTQRIGIRSRVSACALAGLGRCGAPCEGREAPAEYARHAEAAARAMTGDVEPVAAAVRLRIDRLAEQQRYEDAAVHRDRLTALVRTVARMQRLEGLARCRQLVAGSPAADGWDLAVVRHGRLAAAGRLPHRTAAAPHVAALVATAETVEDGPGPTPAAGVEEMEAVLRWLESPGVRLVEVDGTWSCPADGAGRLWSRLRHLAGLSPWQA